MSNNDTNSVPPPAIDRVLETCLYVDDLELAEAFYRDTLGLEFVSRQKDRHVFFRCGSTMLLIFNPIESRQPNMEVPPHGADGSGHIALAIDAAQWKAWETRLNDHGVEIETVVEWPRGGKSMYFRDPAGNSLELAMPSIWGLPG